MPRASNSPPTGTEPAGILGNTAWWERPDPAAALARLCARPASPDAPSSARPSRQAASTAAGDPADSAIPVASQPQQNASLTILRLLSEQHGAMATALAGQSVTFRVAGGKSDALGRVLQELVKAVERRDDERRPLLDYVESDARDLSGKSFNRFLNEIYTRLFALVTSTDATERLAGVRGIDELIDCKMLGETAAKVSRFASYLRDVFNAPGGLDVPTMEAAAGVLGHLVASGGPLAADVVEFEVKRAIEWLAAPDRVEARRYAAVLILHQMADNAPAIFNVYVRYFIDVVWAGLRDPKLYIREASVAALRACLCVVEKRETRYRVQWYYRLFEETQHGLTRVTSIEAVHGSLLALGELLRHTGEFMLARYREVVETVLRFKDSKEKLIRRAVITLLPRLAAFAPERFANTYLQVCCMHLLTVLRNPNERGVGFVALGDMAVALAGVGCAGGMEKYLPAVAGQVKEAVLPKGRHRVVCNEALQVVGVLASALGAAWYPYARQLIEPMVLTGLSESLVDALTKVVEALPQLLQTAQHYLLDLISLSLVSRPYRKQLSPQALQALAGSLASGEMQGIALTRLALGTVGSFDFDALPLIEFVHDVMLAYLDDSDPGVRKAAALAACRVLERQLSSLYAVQPRQANGRRGGGIKTLPSALSSALPLTRLMSKPLGDAGHGGTWPMALPAMQRRTTDKIVVRLLMSGVADSSVSVRRTIFRALNETTLLDEQLVQAECLRSLFVSLNDEDVTIRALALRLTGRLSSTNPAYVMPALRRHLMQLLSDMEHSPDSRQREESAFLLGTMIQAAPRLVLPYVPPILKALVAKLRAGAVASLAAAPSAGPAGGPVAGVPVVGGMQGGGEDSVTATVLQTTGELARVAGCALRPHLGEILPLIIDAIQDGSSAGKRVTAVSTLSLLVESTGLVVQPYQDYPQLLGVLLRMLAEGSPRVRCEVMRVLGVIGALDPHTHKLNQANLQGEGKLEQEGVRPQRPNRGGPGALGGPAGPVGDGAMGGRTYGTLAPLDDGGGDLLTTTGLVTSSEDYYPTVAINALMRVLRDPSCTSLHPKTVHSLFYIFQSMQVTCVPYLPKVMPVLFQVMAASDDALREFLFQQLTVLVSYLRQHVRKYLPELLALANDYWHSSSPLLSHILKLTSELAATMRDDLRAHLPDLLPKFIALFAEAERSGSYDMVRPALAALESLGPALEDHLQLLLPVLMRLVCSSPILGVEAVVNTPLDIRRAALHSMRRLLARMQLAGYTSAILHPLVRVLDGPHEELRRDALDTICALASALGPDFVIFIPTIKKVMARRKVSHEVFARLTVKLTSCGPPCMSDADDWESGYGWLEELVPEPQTVAFPTMADPGVARLPLNENNLRRAWECSSRSTKDDWAEWMRHFSVELLKESPSPALRACHAIAQAVPQMARELFAAGFVSCWSELEDSAQEALVRSLEAALASPTIPPEIVTTLLNLAEFMEHDEKALPLDTRTLGALAEKCHAFAKALHYKELEFVASPTTAVEALISINNQLRQPDAAVGILTIAETQLKMTLQETWYEKLQRWDEALAAYEAKYAAAVPNTRQHTEAALGRLRCLAALAEWDSLAEASRTEWRKADPHMKQEVAQIGAQAAWHMGLWDDMQQYVAALRQGDASDSSNTHFLSAVLAVRKGNYEAAKLYVDKTRDLLGTELAALVGESYERAYSDMVRVQQVTELEEVIRHYTGTEGSAFEPAAMAGVTNEATRWALTQEMWAGRLRGVQRNVEVWQALLSVRTLVVPMDNDHVTWLKFAALCRKSNRTRQARRTYVKLLQYDPESRPPGTPGYGAGSGAPEVMYGFLKHLWANGEKGEAYLRMIDLSTEVQEQVLAAAVSAAAAAASSSAVRAGGGAAFRTATATPAIPSLSALSVSPGTAAAPLAGPLPPLPAPGGSGDAVLRSARVPLVAKVHYKLANWQWYLAEMERAVTDAVVDSVLAHARISTESAPRWGKAWHTWGVHNVGAMEHYHMLGVMELAQRHVAPAVTGYFKSVSLSQASGSVSNLQDILRLLTLWFTHGSTPDVGAALHEGFGQVSICTWLVVIPQIIARIHTNVQPVRRLIHSLLVRIGKHHPQALMYPLLVACKSQSPSRRAAALAVMENVRQHSATLVEQAQLVSQELIRMAILWHEMWHEALEEASRLYFGESNVEGMLGILLPLHEMMEKQGPTTLKEIAFVQAYGRELQEAYEWCLKYKASRKEAELHQAWDLYYHVFKRINKQLPQLTVLELQYVAPALVRATALELAVPGTYIVGEPLVTIAAFAPQLQVITSKQRPRKLTIHGNDGAEYMFLLKGHEDLRQDERVMQLFGLVNGMLAADRVTAERDLSIARYAVIPLSPNSGLIGWVPNTDTLHALIREYRDARKVPLNVEHRLMLGMAPDYDHLMVIQKVEVFDHALDSTSGEDLHKVLWLKSRNSEVWLDRRTNYTRSLAVMSVVGYLLGLGDRHPSNLMLDRYSGKLLHIDFGDCFEASMVRDKFPEKVPFRLTRMLIKAMEVSGVEGTFRATCEHTMRVLRAEKDSVMAMLEAFVHDPLINWRLLNAGDAPPTTTPVTPTAIAGAAGEKGAPQPPLVPPPVVGALVMPGLMPAPPPVAPLMPLAPQAAALGGEGRYGEGESFTAQAQQAHINPLQPGDNNAYEQALLADPGELTALNSPLHMPTREQDLNFHGATEVLNERAVAVMKRMSDKLTGRDFLSGGEGGHGADDSASVHVQVDRLIRAATSHENLCQSYVGWCPFW